MKTSTNPDTYKSYRGLPTLGVESTTTATKSHHKPCTPTKNRADAPSRLQSSFDRFIHARDCLAMDGSNDCLNKPDY